MRHSLEAARHETNEQIRARMAEAGHEATGDQADQAAGRARGQWKSFPGRRVGQAQLAVLDAADARAWANARAAASPGG